jgi:hypothetical protein
MWSPPENDRCPAFQIGTGGLDPGRGLRRKIEYFLLVQRAEIYLPDWRGFILIFGGGGLE